ncbi:hypothetical protein [Dermatophilus congolensis]|uniref:hypothetical protein n=1 Tax=Dermatophilus congolensis TaxID=1863 RepID=UPI001AAEF6B1|nr:hypothetical protein [Dermatophilus congolensis]MBO3128687.1 hypothetical protein [Dermatophilus congolensis]MBO3132676.1 hypothetical protein [Dermatophilus congolensis]MBO3133163.1 hypothetical protein [Dermatophilus congolensis]MBO3135398.1 hypothetical protein [Dermatophilus congolensis]MBO3137639.1 hypothetical protein [Dermatophilus congolensis]
MFSTVVLAEVGVGFLDGVVGLGWGVGRWHQLRWFDDGLVSGCTPVVVIRVGYGFLPGVIAPVGSAQMTFRM